MPLRGNSRDVNKDLTFKTKTGAVASLICCFFWSHISCDDIATPRFPRILVSSPPSVNPEPEAFSCSCSTWNPALKDRGRGNPSPFITLGVSLEGKYRPLRGGRREEGVWREKTFEGEGRKIISKSSTDHLGLPQNWIEICGMS